MFPCKVIISPFASLLILLHMLNDRQLLLSGRNVILSSLHCSWKREIRVKKIDSRMKGETWYYTPCGRRMKQFPEIIKVHEGFSC